MRNFKVYFILISFTSLGCKADRGKLLRQINFPNYPSASAIVSNKYQFFMVGDDAATIWRLDSNYLKTGQINLYTSAEKRIPKDIKEDMEAITVLKKMDSTFLLLLGSGSTVERQHGWEININSEQKTNISMAVFYRRLQLAGIKDINIEGLTATEQGFILANRGHLDYRMNYLIFTSPDFYKNQENAPITLVKFGFQKENDFLGISGLSYSFTSGHLYGSLSSEKTSSSYADGEIGSSSIFILKDVLQKQKLAAVNPNIQIDLMEIRSSFKQQKIESLTLLKEETKSARLLLAADNDNGESTLFEIEIKK